MTIIQNLPPVFWTTPIRLFSKGVYVHWYENGKRYEEEQPTLECAQKTLDDKTNKGLEAFISAPVPCNDNQRGVIAYSNAGRFVDHLAKFKDAKVINEKIDKAYNSVIGSAKTATNKNIAMQTIKPTSDKDDPMSIVVGIKFEGYNKMYTYRAKEWHNKGDIVCVFDETNEVIKEVKVVCCGTRKESAIIAFAHSIGRDNLATLYSEEPMPYEEDFEAFEAMKAISMGGHDYEATSYDWEHIRDCAGEYDDVECDDLPE